MSNLLAIESAFLRLENIETALNLRSIQVLQRGLANGQKKKFSQTLELSKKVVIAVEWFKSQEGKDAMNESGIYWTTEEVGNKVFGWQKSYLYKVVKAGNLPDEKIEKFNTLCDESEANGDDPNRTLEGLLKFAKGGTNANSDGGTNDANDDESEDESEAQIEVRTPTIFTLSYKKQGGNIALRIDENNKMTTTNTDAEILEAIQFLASIVSNNLSN